MLKLISVFAASLLCLGCTTPSSLYQWEDYQPQVYKYLKDDGKTKEEQILVLEKGLQKIQANGKTPPPGYHAHLGLLYYEVGRAAEALQQFQTEKALFPESAKYMNFLLNKTQNKGEK